MNKQLIIFDLDGCLLDTSEGIGESVRFTLSELGCKLPSGVKIDNFIGPPIQNSLKTFLKLSPEESQIGANIFREYYKNHALLKAKPYPRVEDTLSWLNSREKLCAVATYKREDYAITLLEKMDLSQYFNIICGADNFNKLTKKDIIEKCIHNLAVNNEDALMIGDTMSDFTSANELNVDFIGVTWGFGFTEQCDYPFQVIKDISELQSIIL